MVNTQPRALILIYTVEGTVGDGRLIKEVMHKIWYEQNKLRGDVKNWGQNWQEIKGDNGRGKY